MEYTAYYSVALVLIAANFGQIQSILLRKRSLDDADGIDLKDPTYGEDSSGIIYYNYFKNSFRKYEKTVLLTAPQGYGLLITFSLIDFRPNKKDILTLSVPGMNRQETYTNAKTGSDRKAWDKEDGKQFYSPNGQISITFESAERKLFEDRYEGFQFTWTVQGDVDKPETCKKDVFICTSGKCIASALKCDSFLSNEYNHCGDRSDHSERACGKSSTVAIALGVSVTIFLLIFSFGVGYLIFRKIIQPRRMRGFVTKNFVR